MEFDTINHRTLAVNGIDMHIAEKGEGPVVLLLHGFPELWYSWRHQIISLSSLGYHAVAPDLRGYGDTTAPVEISSYTIFHLIGDVVALIDALGQDQVFVVGHDWGAVLAWNLCMFRPEMVKALVILSVPFSPYAGRMDVDLVEYFKRLYGDDDYYITRFQAPGVAEAEFARLGTKMTMRKFLTLRDPGPLLLPSKEVWGSPDDQIALPSWLSEDDVDYFTSKLEKSGFTGGINYYRSLPLNWELSAPWSKVQIKAPTKFIVGDLDITYHHPGIQDYIHKGGFKADVPFLEDIVVMEGVAHFINQEKPVEISEHIYNFIKKF